MTDYEQAYRNLQAGVEAVALDLDRGDSIDRGIAADLRALLTRTTPASTTPQT